MVCLIFGLLLFFDNHNFQLKSLHKYYKNSIYYVYSYQDINYKNKIKNGDYFIYKLSNDKIKFVNTFCEELVIFENANELGNILNILNIKIQFTDKNFGLIYGYSPYINNYLVILNNKNLFTFLFRFYLIFLNLCLNKIILSIIILGGKNGKRK